MLLIMLVLAVFVLGHRHFVCFASNMIFVRSSMFFLFEWHEFHAAFRTIAGMIHHDFGMHRARVFLSLLVLVIVIVLVARAIGVNRPYLCNRDERYRARD